MYAWNIPQVDTGPLCSSMHEQALVTSVLRPGELPVWEILTTRAGPTRNDGPGIIVRWTWQKLNVTRPGQEG